jgi:hypothetical protein
MSVFEYALSYQENNMSFANHIELLLSHRNLISAILSIHISIFFVFFCFLKKISQKKKDIILNYINLFLFFREIKNQLKEFFSLRKFLK